jgi:carboxyl-terminal processing protease
MTTYDEFLKLKGMKSRGMEKLILDLRENSGGVMEAAIKIADEFLSEGEMIVYTLGRSQPRNEARATANGEFETGDLVLLIDEWSASASEILAGAIQDNDRGTIIGRRSFGKGLVQEPVPFTDGSGMRLTIARYYTPTGRSIQKPYNNGFDEYFDDLNSRFERGEFTVSDSIHFADSLKFTTRVVKPSMAAAVSCPNLCTGRHHRPFFIFPFSKTPDLQVCPQLYRKKQETLKKFTESGEIEKFLDRQAFSTSSSVLPNRTA